MPNVIKQGRGPEGYRQVKFWIPNGTADTFKKKCAAAGIPMASVIPGFMGGQEVMAASQKAPRNAPATRQQRGEAATKPIQQLEGVMETGRLYMGAGPVGLQDPVRYGAAPFWEGPSTA